MQCVVECHLTATAESTLADDGRDGLTRPFKELPPKHVYDDRGGQPFDRICELPEYYPARTERAILERFARHVAQMTAAVELAELRQRATRRPGTHTPRPPERR